MTPSVNSFYNHSFFKSKYSIVILFIFSFLFYYMTLDNYFLADDFYIISDLFDYESSNYWVSFNKLLESLYYAAGGGFYWRPTTFLVFAFNGLIWGLNPLGYHIFSVFLLFMSSIALYYISLRFINPMGSFIIALLFIAHPLHTEAITFINAVADPLCAVLSLFTILCWIKYRENGRRLYLIISLVIFIVALLTKEFALVVPGFFVVYEWMLSGREKRKYKEIIVPILTFGVIEILYLMTRSYILPSSLGLVNKYPPNIELLKSIVTIPFGFVFAPTGLNGPYGLWIYTGISFFFSLIMIYLALRGNKKVIVLFCWYILSLLPIYMFLPNLSNFYLVPNTRFLYFPSSIGLILLIYVVFTIIKSIKLNAILVSLLLFMYLGGLLRSNQIWEVSSDIVKQTNQFIYEYVSEQPGKSIYADLNGLYFVNGATAYFDPSQIGLGLKRPFMNMTVEGNNPIKLSIFEKDMSLNEPASNKIVYFKMNIKDPNNAIIDFEVEVKEK